jgi:hypothetical protein
LILPLTDIAANLCIIIIIVDDDDVVVDDELQEEVGCYRCYTAYAWTPIRALICSTENEKNT